MTFGAGPVVQRSERAAHNGVVAGSNPAGPTTPARDGAASGATASPLGRPFLRRTHRSPGWQVRPKSLRTSAGSIIRASGGEAAMALLCSARIRTGGSPGTGTQPEAPSVPSGEGARAGRGPPGPRVDGHALE